MLKTEESSARFQNVLMLESKQLNKPLLYCDFLRAIGFNLAEFPDKSTGQTDGMNMIQEIPPFPAIQTTQTANLLRQ